MLLLRLRLHDARRLFIRAIPFVAALALSVAASATRSHADTPTGPHASANAAQPMRFVRVRSDSDACSPNCPEWISAEGKIVTGSADALERTLNAIGNRRLPIVINSAGGSVRDAMDMGRLIRAKRLAVVVARTTLTHCPLRAKSCGLEKGVADSRDAYCASACTLVLAAGVERYVSPLSFVGVHQMTEVVRETQVKRIYKVHYLKLAGLKLELSRHQIGEQRLISTAKLAADDDVDDEVSDYFQSMGVAEPVMKLTLATPSKGIHWLTNDELKTSRLATAWVQGPKPFLDTAQPSGLDGLAVDASAEATSQFAAKLATPLSAPIGERRAALDVTFAFRRGGGAVATSFALHDAQTGAPLALPGAGAYLIFYPQGAQYRTGRLALDATARVVAPLRSFCRLQDGGRAILSFIAPNGVEAQTIPHPAPVVFTPLAAEGGAALFDEACPPRVTGAGAIASAGGVSDHTAQ